MGCCQSKEIPPPKTSNAIDRISLVCHVKGNPRDNYRTIKILGKGGFGTVTLVKDRRTGALRAMKELPKSVLTENDTATMLKEVTTLSTVDHPNIMKIYELIESNTSYNIITELIEGGELLDMISREKKLTESTAVKFLYEIMSAIYYCHSIGIVHRDLKPQNILLTNKETSASIKVIDFGIADKLNSKIKITEVIGTPLFMSPEMFAGSYDEKCDIWSSGVILYLMITGTVPFTGNGVAAIKASVTAAKVDFSRPAWSGISDELKDLLRNMLVPDPRNRFSAKQVLDHPVFARMHAGSLSTNPISTEAFENLQRFHAQNKLEKSILTFITTNIMDDSSNKELIDLFRSIDTNNDGRLSKEEIMDGYQEIGLTLEHAQEIISTIDSDQSGLIEYSEFITATQNWKKVCEKDFLEKAFKIYDIGKDGNLSLNELKQLIPGIENSDWDQFLREADKNGDGLISLSEFRDYIMIKFSN